MLELVGPKTAALWDGLVLQVINAQDGSLRALHVAHIRDARLGRALGDSSYTISINGTEGLSLTISVPEPQLFEAEALVNEINGAITRRRAGKA